MEALEACECPVCFNEFDEDKSIPLATVCGHTICQKCIHLLEDKSEDYRCPLCRNLLQVGSCKVNVALRQLIKELWKLRHTRNGVPLARSPSVLDIPYGDILFDEIIDSGAFGEVYTARWRGNRVAVKQLRGAQINNKSLTSFQREVYVMNCLRHPNIVLLLGACQAPPRLCIVMELLKGGSLHHMIHENEQSLTLSEIQQVSIDVACGLQYLHGINILHRDLKSKNVLLTNDQFPCQAKLCDFGLARMRQETATMTGNIGTVHWTAPEIMSNKRYRFTADVYSLGMVLYEMAAGKLPFAEMIPMAVMVAVVVNKQRPSMDDIKSRHGDKPELLELIEKCTEWEASQRPNVTDIISLLTDLIPMETSGKRAKLVNQQSSDLQNMTIDGLNIVFVAESSSDLTDTTSSFAESSIATGLHSNTERHEEFFSGAVGGQTAEANDPDLELAMRLQQEEADRYHKQLEQDEALARHLQHQDFSYRLPVTASPKKMPGPELMKSVRKFDQSQLRHNVPEAPPPPPLPSPVATNPTIQLEHEDSKPSFTNYVATGSPYLKVTSTPDSKTAGHLHKPVVKPSLSLPAGDSDGWVQNSSAALPAAPPPPPVPHLPIRRQPSALLHEIRGDSKKRWSGYNLGTHHRLRHVETVEKRAFNVGRVVGHAAHAMGHPFRMITTQELVKAFNKLHLNKVSFSEPQPEYPVGRVVPKPPVHVPKMKAKFSSKTNSVAQSLSKKRAPNRLKKSAATTAPEEELPWIPPVKEAPMRTEFDQQPMKKSSVAPKMFTKKH